MKYFELVEVVGDCRDPWWQRVGVDDVDSSLLEAEQLGNLTKPLELGLAQCLTEELQKQSSRKAGQRRMKQMGSCIHVLGTSRSWKA